MDSPLPDLRYVELVEEKGIVRHSYEGLLEHLERHLDPNIRDNILFFYLSGSRLYGTSTEASDWDYVCVTKGETKEARKSQACIRHGDESISAAKPLMITDSNVYDMDATLELYGLPIDPVPVGLRFDVCLITLSVWKRLAYEHSIIALEAQFLPPAFVLYKDKDFPVFKIDPPILKTTASLMGGLKFANSRPRLNEGNYAKAKRLGALGIRYMQFGIQLLESMRDTGSPNITDWHSIKPVWEGMFAEHTPTNYADFETLFRPTFKGYDTQIRQIMVYPTLYTTRERFSNAWAPLKTTLVKLNKIPAYAGPSPFEAPSWLSEESKTLLQAIVKDPASAIANEAASKHHLIPSISKCGTLLSLSATSSANFYADMPANQLHGMIFTLPEWKTISPANFSYARDIISLKSLSAQQGDPLASLGEIEKDTIAALEDEGLEVRELYDGFRVAVYFYGEWRISCTGGTVDGSERLATRTTEGRGPSRATVAEQFITAFSQATSFGKTSPKSLDLLQKDQLYVFDLLTDSGRAITANPSADSLVFQFCTPLSPSSETVVNSLPAEWNISLPTRFETIQSEVRALEGWKAKLNRLIEAVEFVNPFEQAGFELRASNGKVVKISSRSYWSVKASLGHQNRVLAFNVAADHFEPESLLDTCVYGFRREFSESYPKWTVPLDAAELELKQLCNFLDGYKAQYFGESDRKAFATIVAKIEAPLRAICFEWYNYAFVPAHDVIASLDLATLRQLKERFAEHQKSEAEATK